MSMINRQLRTAADKRLRYTSPKLPSATSFIPGTLSENALYTKDNIFCEEG